MISGVSVKFIPTPQPLNDERQAVVATSRAFSALSATGGVVCWGDLAAFQNLGIPI